ncbi:BEL1-like homeodomain protein 11 [Andrographis paniculata]|uniref:BEL1-like homeodomain protein 11 n=1 Tax=Andrographis paniculata TaxID=175694 RepID=UPI0021E85212|nr:BEL1-like homeodomain protein 11 [Andrographis paniculata]
MLYKNPLFVVFPTTLIYEVMLSSKAMVSEDPPCNSNSSINVHQFNLSNSIADDHTQIYNNPSYPLPVSIQCCLGDRISASVDLVRATDESGLMDLLGASNEASPAPAPARLSLSLGGAGQRPPLTSCSLVNPGYLISRESCNVGPDNHVMNDYSFTGSGFPSSTPPWNPNSAGTAADTFAAAVGASKYLKSAQSLLLEMVSVAGKDIDASNQKYVDKLSCKKGSHRLSSEIKADISNNNGGLLSERHSTYVNLLKLLALLDEVEKRYDDYYGHIEELVGSFEMIAGWGAGKSYTALALQAMSKHFSTLRDAIVSQIRVTKQKIERDMPRISSGLSQLSLVDQDGRQPRISLHQLWPLHGGGGGGGGGRQIWRPIRGLPETSVTLLRAWLFEHFLHPYPNESEKLMLASQTGLSKNQVSNWFINARVRLWKPMIEEMYKEEFGEGVGDSADD